MITELTQVEPIRSYLNRIGAEPRSLRTAVVRRVSGDYWRDIAIIRFSKTGEIECSTIEHAPTDLERSMVSASLAGAEWPELKRLQHIIDPPQMLRDADPAHTFEYRDREGLLVMVQVRQEKKGERFYCPFTFWSDDRWRMCEPDTALPLYNADKIGDNTTVFIHEGAKAARAMQEMVDAETPEAKCKLANHPWGRELSGAVHVGFTGGALSPLRTDWSVLAKAGVKMAYIVADNDSAGRSAVPGIAQQLRMPTFSVQFTQEWPGSFDLADPFPKDMFSKIGTEPVYTGPSFRDCLHPATWATDVVPPKKEGGRPGHVLRESFKGMWAYIEESDIFVNTYMPEIMRTEAILNKMLASFSHVQDTCRLIVKAYQGRSTRVCYRPDVDGLKVTFRGSSAINLHVPSNIRPMPGDPQPFLDFMAYMFVHENERYQALRWMATLIARPDIRMSYGLLLISEKQGVGKTTLGAAILAPLVGMQNVSYPSENDITSSFNEWVAHKRLAIVNEIYSGSSWRAYHQLKGVITDKDITVNQKYMRQYTIENWCHIVASSNSMRALKMENDDRRWFYPEVTEVPWPKGKFTDFRKWLNGGGLSIVLHWAKNWSDYVDISERAPTTERKREMIEGSRSEAQEEAVAVAEVVMDLGRPAALLIKDIVNHVRTHVKVTTQARVYDSDYEIRRSMVDCGMVSWPKRIKVHGRLQYALLNKELVDIAQRSDAPLEAIREHVVKCADLMAGAM